MVKVYEGGALSGQLAAMELGESVDFKHIPFNVKIQYPRVAVRFLGGCVFPDDLPLDARRGMTPQVQQGQGGHARGRHGHRADDPGAPPAS